MASEERLPPDYSGRANSVTMVNALRLKDLYDLQQHIELPKTLSEARPIIKSYLEAMDPSRHWRSVNEMVLQLMDEGSDYYGAHEEKMNMKSHIIALEMANHAKMELSKQYDEEVRAFRKEHPGIRGTSQELRMKVPPTEWESYKEAFMDEREKPRRREKKPQGPRPISYSTEGSSSDDEEERELKKQLAKKRRIRELKKQLEDEEKEETK
jgi:hypothetical protein